MSQLQDYDRYNIKSYPDVFATTRSLRARPQVYSRVPYSDDTSSTTRQAQWISILAQFQAYSYPRKRSQSYQTSTTSMAPAFLSNFMSRSAMADYIELKQDEWNNVVDDETQCMVITQEEEIRYLSRLNKNLAEYLKLHPEMAHELMVPAGFKERIPRRYERMLSGEKSISSQNGMLDDARTNEEILKGMMDRPFKVLKNPTGAPEPQWYELVNWVHNHEDEARRYEHRETGELVRTIKYGRQEIQVSERYYKLMWDHVACRFTNLPFWDMDALECRALHRAWAELTEIPETWNTWHFPIGQRIQICIKQIEARMGGLHRRSTTHECCSNPRHHDTLGVGSKEYLTKAEAAALVIEERKATGKTLHACNYDPVVKLLLNIDEKVEQGVLTARTKSNSMQVPKGVMTETDGNEKVKVHGAPNLTEVWDENDADEAKVKLEPESGTQSRTTSVSTSILDLNAETDWPMPPMPMSG